MSNILVTGGAGYVGSHVCKALQAAGFTPVTFDNLSVGWRDAVRFGPFEHGDIRNAGQVARILDQYRPLAVMHLAALSDIAQSMRDPQAYWQTNVDGTSNLLAAMGERGIGRIVFSSTCAIYAASDDDLTEDSPCAPVNTYGQTKLAAEAALQGFVQHPGTAAASLRFFNVAGADAQSAIGEAHIPESHLIPLALQAAAGTGPALTINGTDYATPDGTCIRDFVHVEDLARAHVAAMDWLATRQGLHAFNLGAGTGYSVRQVLDCVGQVTGGPVPFVVGPRRVGDAARLVSCADKAGRDLGWVAKRSELQTMIADAWRWHCKGGFGG